jgi:hypothetical protein
MQLLKGRTFEWLWRQGCCLLRTARICRGNTPMPLMSVSCFDYLDALYSTKLQVDGVEVDLSHVIAHSRFGKGPACNCLPRHKYERMQNTTAAVGHAAYFASGRRNTTVI